MITTGGRAEHAVILAAGEGKRLRPFTENKPKCLAKVAGRPLLDRALSALSDHGCKEVKIVTGHLSHVVRDSITDRFACMRINYVENREYAATNSMFSLALALDGVDQPTWVLEGDVIFDPAILSFSPKSAISWFADSSASHLDGAYIQTGAENLAVALDIVGHPATRRRGQHKSIGVLHLMREGVGKARQWLAKGVREGRCNDYYDLIFRDHLGSNLVRVEDIAGHRWFEVDTLEDLDRANALFS